MCHNFQKMQDISPYHQIGVVMKHINAYVNTRMFGGLDGNRLIASTRWEEKRNSNNYCWSKNRSIVFLLCWCQHKNLLSTQFSSSSHSAYITHQLKNDRNGACVLARDLTKYNRKIKREEQKSPNDCVYVWKLTLNLSASRFSPCHVGWMHNVCACAFFPLLFITGVSCVPKSKIHSFIHRIWLRSIINVGRCWCRRRHRRSHSMFHSNRMIFIFMLFCCGFSTVVFAIALLSTDRSK